MTLTHLRFGIALLLLGLAAYARAEEKRPNVLFILSDDQAWTDYGFMGHKTIATPHLDKLAEQSRVYTQGYVPTSLCRASLMSLVTGRYPHQHGITGNDPPKGTPREALLKFVREQPTFPRLLSKAGYRTFQSGKWWEGSYADGGFTHGLTHGDPKRGGRHGDEGLKIGRQGLQPIFDFIQESKDTPWLVWYAPMLPHQPHNPPEKHLAKYRDKVDSPHVAKYFAMCSWWDETCGQLLTYLDDHKLADNTLVIYVCDNGWIQLPDKATFDPRSKRSPYDTGVRTPIMVRWPKHVKPQRIDDVAVSSLSLAPLILKSCGVEIPREWPAPLPLDGQPKSTTVFGEIFEHDIREIDRPQAGLLFRWCRDGKWKLIASVDGRRVELYDLSTDPGEAKNVAAEHPQVLTGLKDKLDGWWKLSPTSNASP